MATKFSIRDSHNKWYTKWVRPEFINADTKVKVNASFLNLVEKKFCKEQIALGKAKTRGKLKSLILSEMTLDSLHSSKNKRKIDATYGYIVNKKNLKRKNKLCQVNKFRWVMSTFADRYF